MVGVETSRTLRNSCQRLKLVHMPRGFLEPGVSKLPQ